MPIQNLNPSATTVAHIGRVPTWWKTDSHFTYIGRTRGVEMHYGNPFSCRDNSLAGVKVATHEESIEEHRKWLMGEAHHDLEPERRQWILDNLYRLRAQTLVCFCHPKSCHGDTLAYMADRPVN